MAEAVHYGHIPVYRSRFTPLHNLPNEYGAFISWEIGERVTVRATNDPRSKPTTGIVKSETEWSDAAPEIDGARGRGRWVREVLCDDDGQLWAISESRLAFI